MPQQLPQLQEAVRLAQAAANEQRSAVGQVQQQIQVLAAEQRSVQEQIAPVRDPARAPGVPISARCKSPTSRAVAGPGVANGSRPGRTRR